MQMKQQQELQRYLQQVQQNIDTMSASELLQALMTQQTYFSEEALSTGAVWSSVVQLAPAPGVIYSTAGLRQSPLPATYTPVSQSLDVSSGSETVTAHQLMSAAVPVNAESVAGPTGATTFSPPVTDRMTSADIWREPDVPAVADVNTDTAAIPDSKTDMAKSVEMAETLSDRCSPGTAQIDGTNSLKEDVRPVSSDDEVSNAEESIHVTVHRKQSAEAAGLLPGALPLESDTAQLPEVSSLGFVPIQNQLISSRSDSMDSMASSVAGCSVQQSVECPDLVHQPTSVRETSVAESKSNTSAQPVTVVSGQLLDTMHSLLGQLAAGNCDAVLSVTPSHSAASEPAQQLQQSQTMIQQQQQQQLATIASAIENLQHLRSLQEVIGNLAVALKSSQLEMLSAALQAREVSGTSVTLATSSVAGSGMTPAPPVHPPTVAVSSSPAVPPAAALITEPRSLAPQSVLGLLQYPAASNAAILMQQQQQQQQQQLLAMLQSAPYQQQVLMQQLLSQNAVMMPDAAGPAGGSRVVQQPWPMMVLPPQCVGSAVRRATPGLPAMALGLPGVTPGLQGMTPGLSGVTPVMVSAQHVAQRYGVPVVTPGSMTSTLQPAAAAPVRPPVTSSSSGVTIPSLQTSLPDQR